MLLAASGLLAQADPQLTSWFTVNSGKTAAIYRTDAEKIAGTPETTWSNGRLSQNRPAYDGVQEILFSSNWIYVHSSGLGSQVMGPWYLDPQHRRLFPNLPTDQNFIFAFPRHPVVQTSRNRDYFAMLRGCLLRLMSSRGVRLSGSGLGWWRGLGLG